MEIGLEDLRIKGRAATPIAPVLVRELRADDLPLLSAPRGVEPSPLKKLRHRHHTLARLLAQGTKVADCKAITGYTDATISILQGDPSFQELVEFYRTAVEEQYLDTHAKLAELTSNAADMLGERMEDEPESFSNKELLSILELGADRTGHGPTATQKVDVNVNFANRLEEARKRVAAARAPMTIEHLSND